MSSKVKITASQAKQRIDKFLAGFYPEKSRAEWQRKIKNREILVDNKIIKADYVLKENDEIKILPAFKFSSIPSLPRKEISIKIIYEDSDVVVLDKPAGVLVHSAKGVSSSFREENNIQATLADFLLKRYPKIKNVGENETRPGIVHRLDKDTSGVIIVAKNNRSFDFLKKQFQERKTEKEYWALVYGKVKHKKGMINLSIARSKNKFGCQTVIDTVKKEYLRSRSATTFYETVKYFKNYTLLKVMPKTGRMHQIRVHLKAIGHPVVGDQKYKFKKLPAVDLKRQFLHAVKLKITLPNGKVKIFRSELAGDLKEFLKRAE